MSLKVRYPYHTTQDFRGYEILRFLFWKKKSYLFLPKCEIKGTETFFRLFWKLKKNQQKKFKKLIFDEFGLFSQVSSHKGKYSHFCWFWWIWSNITCKVLSLRMFYLDLLVFFVLRKTWNNPFLSVSGPHSCRNSMFFQIQNA